MAEKELILELGVEGGGATIYRTRLASGGWLFHVEGDSIFMDENDTEDWRSWTSEPVQTFEEALRSIADDGSWINFYPISIHPEYRSTVWKLVQEIAHKLPEERSKIWESRMWKEWHRLCLEKS